MQDSATMDSLIGSPTLHNEFNESHVGIAATVAVKVEPDSSYLDNSTCRITSSSFVKSEEAVEPVPYHHNCIRETGADGLAYAMKQDLDEKALYSERTSCDLHEFSNISGGVDVAASVAVKIKPDSSYLDDAAWQFRSFGLNPGASTHNEHNVELALNQHFNGQAVFIKQEMPENQAIETDIKHEISDDDFFEIISISKEYDHDLKTQPAQNSTLKAEKRTFLEEQEESNLNWNNSVPLNGTENLSCDCNLLNSMDQSFCNNVKTINIKNCSVLLKRLDITSLKTINFTSSIDSMDENIHSTINPTMDSVIESADLHDEFNTASNFIAVKVEPASSHFDNSMSHSVSSSYEATLKSEQTVEPDPRHYKYIGETAKDGIDSAVKQNSNEDGLHSERTSSDLHEFNNVASDVDIAASITVKIEPKSSCLDSATSQFVTCEASKKSENDMESPLNDFNGQVVFTNQEKVIEDNLIQYDIKHEISDSDFLEITSILEDYDRDLRSQFFQNPTFEVGTRKHLEKCEESDMNAESNVVNETENLSCDLFLNSVDQGVCNSMKTIKLRNCSVFLKRLDITSLKTICNSVPQEQTLEKHKLIHSDMKPYQCSECKKKFKTKQNMNSHKLIHSDMKPFECTECKKKFRQKISLESHKLIHSGKMPYECTECEKKFSWKSDLERHKLIHSGVKPYKCSECKKEFSSKQNFESHKLIHSGMKPFQCTDCEKKFRWKWDLERHKLIHSGVKPYKCSECKKEFRLKQNFESHKLIHSGMKPFECTDCEKKFRWKGDLERHKLIHSGVKPYKCSECKKEFRLKQNFESHKLIHSGMKPFQCTDCEKKFRWKKSLEIHKLIHSGVKPYECSECKKEFSSKQNFESHKLIHSGMKPFECTKCEKKFRQKKNLESHKLIHSGKMPYECTECEKKFRRKKNLESHKLIHSGKMPYECTECEKKFRQKRSLESHKLIHSGKKPYECSECEKKFRTSRYLKKHKLIHSSKISKC